MDTVQVLVTLTDLLLQPVGEGGGGGGGESVREVGDVKVKIM